MKAKRILLGIVGMICGAVLGPATSGAVAPMNNYCIIPPFIQESILPNLLLMIDNSASMYDLAYITAGTYCRDDSYDNTKTYIGYFVPDPKTDPNPTYAYNFTTNKFVAGATFPNACNVVKTDYVCVNTTTTSPQTVNVFMAKGNFLNWLTASKFDIQKQILTGGKYLEKSCSNNGNKACTADTDCSGGTCQSAQYLLGESRGCVGRRFVKLIKNSTGGYHPVTFGVRGPYAYDADYTTQSTQGGATRIEIFAGTYNKADCDAAINDWLTNQNLGTTQTDTKNCLGVSGGATTKTSVYNHVIHECYWYQNNHAFSNLNALQGECEVMYAGYINKYKSDTTVDAANKTTQYIKDNFASIIKRYITTDSQGDSICATDLTHVLLNSNDSGFLGKCMTLTNIKANGSLMTSWDATCSETESKDYCAGIGNPDVSDPSEASYIAGTTTNAPAFLADAGLEALPKVGDLNARVAVSVPPTGILNEFSSQIRMGAMTFNNDGSGSECGQAGTGITCTKYCSGNTTFQCYLDSDCAKFGWGTCSVTVKTDGAQIVHDVGTGKCSATTTTVCYNDSNCPSNERCVGDGVGSHTTAGSLIKSIDDIQAIAWTPFAEAFYNAIGYYAKDPSTGKSRTDLRLQAADFNENRNPSLLRCQSNNVLLITDGMSTADQHSAVSALATLYKGPSNQVGYDSANSCPSYAGSRNLDDLAWLAQNRNIRTFSKSTASTAKPVEKNESITTYVVFNGTGNSATGECNPVTLLQNTASNGGTSLYQVTNPDELEESLRNALKAVAGGTASGTAASILNNSQGSGANLLQAVFYPLKEFPDPSDDTKKYRISWIGEMQNLWYHIDPFLAITSIREDTDKDSSLHLKNDYIVKFFFDTDKKSTLANRYIDSNGDGVADSTTPVDTVSPELVNSLWKAGELLHKRNIATSPRNILTSVNGESFLISGTKSFDSTNAATLKNYLQAATDAEATKIIDYVLGYDAPSSDATQRSRSVPFKGTTPDLTAKHSVGVWKLGDIVSSTPKILSSVRLNNYDLSSPTGYNDASYATYLKSSGYQNRGMVFVGANDGMLHAFNLGRLTEKNTPFEKASLTKLDDADPALGTEMWGFIPKQTLPYLRYLLEPNYSHLFYVDNSVHLVDASIRNPSGCSETNYWNCARKHEDGGGSWRSLLIGGMGLGGASRPVSATCTNCVKAPTTVSEGGSNVDVGYSSYFALDVTNPKDPKYLWEFTGDMVNDNPLGFSTSGPAIVRVGTKEKNGRWFAVFASGPQGLVDTDKHQFLGTSMRTLKLFIVDLAATGKLVKNTSYWVIDTGIANAFGGSLSTSVIDTDRWDANSSGFYSDDAVYVGYTKLDTSGTWNKGGVLRLLTQEDPDPTKWVVRKLIDDIGPVTTSITKLQDRKGKKLWIFFGTGRYFYKEDDTSTTSQQTLYGIQEPCYYLSGFYEKNDIYNACTDAQALLTEASLQNQSSTVATTLDTGKKGWYIRLEKAGNYTNADGTSAPFFGERVITDPIALPSGAVFFTTFKPTSDLCSYGGLSYIWAVRYDTGAEPPSVAMKGQALMQVSTGSFAEIKLAEAFKDKGNRRLTNPIQGVPPKASGLSIITNPKPIKKVLHIQEK